MDIRFDSDLDKFDPFFCPCFGILSNSLILLCLFKGLPIKINVVEKKIFIDKRRGALAIFTQLLFGSYVAE